MLRRLLLVGSLGSLITLGVGFWFGQNLSSDGQVTEILSLDEPQDEVPVYSSGYQTQDFFDLAYEQAGLIDTVDVRSAIVAHHLLVADEIAKVFAMIGNDDAKTVVVISPNHFSQGDSPAQITKASWETPYGLLESDTRAVDEILDLAEVVKREDSTFEIEHGIGGITPFIKRSFPSAKIVALAVDDSLTALEVKQVVDSISLVADVVIASIDMSHYQPQAAQEFHDQVTLLTLESGGCEDCDLEIDSNAALEIISGFNDKIATLDWNMTYHDSSLTMGVATAPEENTSHILGFFQAGEPVAENFSSFHFVGDIMLDRGVRKQIIEADDIYYPWAQVERFLSGTNLVIGNLEGTVNEQASTYTYDPPFRFVFDPSYIEAMSEYVDVVSLANNHASDVGSVGELETQTWLEKIGVEWFGSYRHPLPIYGTDINGQTYAIIGYHQFQPDEATLVEQIRAASDAGEFVIVMPHWGTEYVRSADSAQRRLAQMMVDAGADLIIGGHPHVPQGISVIDGVPVVYSLGNFVFDQEIPETWTALTVGVIITNEEIDISLLPVGTRHGQPTPLDDSSAQTLFESLAEVSDESIQEQIKNGYLILPRYD